MAQSEILEDQLATTPESGCSRSEHNFEKADHHWRRIPPTSAQTANYGADEVSDRDRGVRSPGSTVLFRGGAEGKIRKGLLEDDLIEAVVGLGANLFYGTSIH